jgi:hypothetical protein
VTPADAKRVADLLAEATRKRGAAWRAFDRCDMEGTGILQQEAQGYEADAEKIDPTHESPAWHTGRLPLKEDQ